MSVAFTQSYKDFLVYNSSIPEYSSLLFEEIIDSTSVLAQRATQIHALYDYASTHREGLYFLFIFCSLIVIFIFCNQTIKFLKN